MIEASVWWVLAKVDSKNIERFIFYRNFTKSTVKSHFNNESRFSIFYISRSKLLSRFIWKFLRIHIPISCVRKKIFSSTDRALGILWISVLKEKLTISMFHIITPESDRMLKAFVQPYIEKISLPRELQRCRANRSPRTLWTKTRFRA